MENTNTVLAANISAFRKQKELTQNEFAQRLGVTFQAVSKWENARSAPDISFLPKMADIFNCTIDALFSRSCPQSSPTQVFPFDDDGIIRGIVCRGQTILTVKDKLTDKFTFEVTGKLQSVHSECNVSVNGDVNGECKAGHSIAVSNNLSGGCQAGHSVNVDNNLYGGCNAGHTVNVDNNLYGGCNAGYAISCGNNIEEGDVSAGQKIQVTGNIKAQQVRCEKGTISCRTLQCDAVEGKVLLRKGWKKETLRKDKQS